MGSVATDRQQEAMAELERRGALGQLNPRQQAAFEELKRRRGGTIAASNQPDQPDQPDAADHPMAHMVGVGATGFNYGLAGYVDAVNDGLKALGLPMSDEPFMGRAFVDKYLGGASFQPTSIMEQIVQRTGTEIGANVPFLGGALAVRGANVGKETVRAGKEAAAMASKGTTAGKSLMDMEAVGQHVGMAEQQIRALKGVPAAIVEQMTQVGPAKLAAIETMLAAGAGAGAGAVQSIFPEGGRVAEFFGELLGSFAPSVVLGLVQRAKQAGQSLGRVVGLETEEDTKRRLGKELSGTATPEQIRAGVKQGEALETEFADKLGPEGPKLKLTAGEAITEGSVSDIQRSQERASKEFRAKARDQRAANIEAVKQYYQGAAPEGNTTRYADTLEQERQRLFAEADMDVARSQAKLDAVRGDIDARTANLLNDMEARMSAADDRVAARLRAIGPQLGKKQRGEIIRSEYQSELGKFREQSKTDYAELDALGSAELPVTHTMVARANLEGTFPEQFQVIRKMSPRLAKVLDNLGRDYELLERVAKAKADLEITPSHDRGGFRAFEEAEGQGSTKNVRGIQSSYPEWYRSITNKKIAGTDNVLDRDTIEKALDTLETGTSHGLHEKTVKYVEDAIRRDPEFRQTPYYHPVMGELQGAPSNDLKVLRQFRSDLLALARQARAGDNRTQGYVLNELVGAVDEDLNQLLPGSGPFADFYPEHGMKYRQVSADYRKGVDTLMKGTANKLRRVNRYGDYTLDDESVPATFWRNETSIQDFQKAFGNRDMARIALRDYALEQYLDKTAYRTPDGRMVIDASASDEWLKQNGAKLQAFPGLEQAFRNTQRMQEEADALRQQVEAYRSGKRGEAALRRKLDAERRPGELTSDDISKAEASLKHAQDVAERTKQDWQASKASLFLKERANVVGYKIATAQDPLSEYERAVKLVKGDPDAVAGLNRAIWEGLTEKLEPKMIGMSGETNLGTFHKELRNWIEGHGKIMQRVLPPENYQRLKTTADVLERISRGGRDRSDTAINLQVQAALASTWLSRAFAIQSGRVGHVFGVTERVGHLLTKTFEKMTRKQQDAILLESFFDPKVFETMVLAGTHGPQNRLVQHRLHMHLYNMNVADDEKESK